MSSYPIIAQYSMHVIWPIFNRTLTSCPPCKTKFSCLQCVHKTKIVVHQTCHFTASEKGAKWYWSSRLWSFTPSPPLPSLEASPSPPPCTVAMKYLDFVTKSLVCRSKCARIEMSKVTVCENCILSWVNATTKEGLLSVGRPQKRQQRPWYGSTNVALLFSVASNGISKNTCKSILTFLQQAQAQTSHLDQVLERCDVIVEDSFLQWRSVAFRLVHSFGDFAVVFEHTPRPVHVVEFSSEKRKHRGIREHLRPLISYPSARSG